MLEHPGAAAGGAGSISAWWTLQRATTLSADEVAQLVSLVAFDDGQVPAEP